MLLSRSDMKSATVRQIFQMLTEVADTNVCCGSPDELHVAAVADDLLRSSYTDGVARHRCSFHSFRCVVVMEVA